MSGYRPTRRAVPRGTSRSISRLLGELWSPPHPAACQLRHHRVSTGLFFLFGVKPSKRGGSEILQVCVGPRIRPIDDRAWSERGEALGQSRQFLGSIRRQATESVQQKFFFRADRHHTALLESVYGGLSAKTGGVSVDSADGGDQGGVRQRQGAAGVRQVPGG